MFKLAFTMVELLVVFLIISILAVFGIFTYNKFLGSAKNTACISKHNFIVKWFEVEMQQCRLGVQPHAEPGRGDQTYDIPPYGHITKLSRHNPWYNSCRGHVDHHASSIAAQWGPRYMNPFLPDCNPNKNNCHESRGFAKESGIPTVNGLTNVWGYYTVLNKYTDGEGFYVAVNITFTSLCNDQIFKSSVITSHTTQANQSEINKYNIVEQQNQSNNNEEDNNSNNNEEENNSNNNEEENNSNNNNLYLNNNNNLYLN